VGFFLSEKSYSMHIRQFSLLAAGIGATFASLLTPLAQAAPVMALSIENLMPMAPDFKKSLNLNANQQLLWQQVDSRTRAAMRARQMRRDALQETLKKDLSDPKLELRDAAKKLDAEAELSHLEDQQLRELWLTVNDALDDGQRAKVIQFFADQLQRDLHGEAPKHEAKRSEGGPGGPGGRGGMGGGMGGNGGSSSMTGSSGSGSIGLGTIGIGNN
jgi:uncharacterized membrane protein YgcG